jgi:apolipoprotein N-acyltransferase
MSIFFTKLNLKYQQWNDFIYKYLLFLYNLKDYKKIAYLLLLGVLTALSLPPTKLFFVLPFTFATIIRLIDFAKTLKEVFIISFYFCFGFFITSLYWISFAVLHDETFFWLQPIALLGIPIILAVYTSLMFLFYFKIIKFSSAIHKIVLFSCLWVLFEYGRYKIFQFPWNFIGYSFTFSLSLLQSTSIVGILGFSLIVVFWACSFHLTFLTGEVESFVSYLKIFIFINIAILVMFFSGLVKLKYFNNEFTNSQMRIIQGNSKIIGDAEEEIEKHISLSISKPYDNISYLIWPEGGVNTLFLKNQALQNRLKNILKDNQTLILGSIRQEKGEDKYKFFNSMIFFNNKGISFYYDKNYLVPFGEFVPFKNLIPIKAISSSISDLSRGNGIQSIKISPEVPPFSPLICYEVAFTGNIINYSKISPEWILNITNDAWYFKSSASFQHFEIARVRAIEEGLPLVRATNSGISAVFDQNGKVLFKTNLFTEEVLDFYLPKKQGGRTLFSFLGNAPTLIFIWSIVLWSVFSFIRKTKLQAVENLIMKFLK